MPAFILIDGGAFIKQLSYVLQQSLSFALTLELEALLARIELPESYEAVEALFSGTVDLASTYKPGVTEHPQQQKTFNSVT
jgi:hypothetical protein